MMRNALEVRLRTTVLRAGTFGYHTFRIPALVALSNDVVVVAAEGRRDSLRDWGQIDLVMRRSCDGGHTFDAPRTLITQPGFTSGNPTWVFDERTSTLALLFCRNHSEEHEKLVFEGQAERSVWICFSRDLGQSFSEPREITSQVKLANWTWYATGPGHGLTLSGGRWVVPCCHAVAVNATHEDPVYSHLIVSDDEGVTWTIGARSTTPRSSECGVAEVGPNEVYVDFRHDQAPHHRGGAFSTNAGETFAWEGVHANVTDPGCRGGVTAGGAKGEVWLSHALGPKRRGLVLDHSVDSGRNFTQRLVLDPGYAAYSDLVWAQDKLLCAYETGENSPYERIDWLVVA